LSTGFIARMIVRRCVGTP